MRKTKLILFGSPRLERDGQTVGIRRRKSLAMLAYLAATAQAHSRDTLATLFWPEANQRKARANLRRALSDLNRDIGEGILLSEGENVTLAEQYLWVDVVHFRACLAACTSHSHTTKEVCPDCLPLLVDAAALYQADFLTGFTLRDTVTFDDWQYFEAEELRQDYAALLERLVVALSAKSDYEAAIPYVRRWLALNPLHEPAQQALIQLYHQTGQPSAALRQYEIFVELLDQELGLSPSEETITLVEAIKTNKNLGSYIRSEPLKRDQDKETAVGVIAFQQSHLPVQPIPLIGREREVAEISQLLADSGCRLLTLTGPGGIGKTRLSVAVAARIRDRFPHGVYFVSLAPLNLVTEIVPALAEAVNFRFYEGGEATQQLLSFLQDKQMLLVLDNFEHLIPRSEPGENGVALLAEILQNASGVKALATSRERLNLREEAVYTLGGLALPNHEHLADALGYDAPKLFMQQARLLRPNFKPNESEVTQIAHICQLTEGSPLALILAASWLEVLSITEISTEIKQSLDFLETDLHDVPDRQRSMRAVIDTSWIRLSMAEQQAFMKLSIFRGGFSRMAAQQVADATLPTLRRLASKSFISLSQPARYEIHELLRQYGLEKLSASNEATTTYQRHSRYYLELLHQRTPDMIGPKQIDTLDEIENDLENIQAAWNWAVSEGNFEAIARSLETIDQFYWIRSRLNEGLTAFQNAVEGLQQGNQLVSPSLERILVKLLTRKFKFDHALGRNEVARAGLQENLARIQCLGDKREYATCLNVLGDVACGLGEFSLAKQYYHDHLKIIKEVGEEVQLAYALFQLGFLGESVGDYVEAKQALEESLIIFRKLDHQAGLAQTLDKLGMITYALGEYQQSEAYFTESLTRFRRLGDRVGQAMALGGTGFIAWSKSDIMAARNAWTESMALRRETGHQFHLSAGLVLFAHFVYDIGAYQEVQSYCQEALAIAQKSGDNVVVGWAYNGLGIAAYGQGDIVAARSYMQKALQSSLEFPVDTLIYLTYWPSLLQTEADQIEENPSARQSKREMALEITYFVVNHPMLWQFFKDRGSLMIAEMETDHTAETVATIKERAKMHTLPGIISKLLNSKLSVMAQS